MRKKIFNFGKFPQGNFIKEFAEKLFTGLEKVDLIFAHTSKWNAIGKEPLVVGVASEFEIVGNEVFAKLDLNKQGSEFQKLGLIKGISVEISDKLNKIAVLPIGVNPAVAGAEFQEFTEFEDMKFESEPMAVPVEFEDVVEATILNVTQIAEAIASLDATTVSSTEMSLLHEAVWNLSDKKWYVEKLKAEGYTVTSETSEMQVQKTEAELRAEITAEFEAKEKVKSIMASAKDRVAPAIMPILEFGLNEATKSNEFIEFEAGKKSTRIEEFSKIIELLPAKGYFEKKSKFEFSEKISEFEAISNEAKEFMKQRQGGI